MSRARDPLQPHFVVLCSQLNVERVLPYLKQERMVTPEEYELLIHPGITVQQKRERLLIMLPRKGSDYFKNFGNCLVWSGQTELARHIGINISAVPKPKQPPLPDTPANVFQRFESMISPGGDLPPGMYVPQVVPQSLPIASAASALSATTVGHSSQPEIYSSSYMAQLQAQRISGQTAPRVAAPYVPRNGEQQEPRDVNLPVHSTPAAMHPTSQPPQPYSGPGQQYHVPQTVAPLLPTGGVGNGEVPNASPRLPKVFILYHKEKALQQTHNVDFSQNVLDLANTLGAIGGLQVSLDMYETDGHVGNWNKWTEDKIKESDFVLLVCSPSLYLALQRAGQNVVEMEKGQFFANSVVNLIHPPKFIPVFFDNCRPQGDLMQWIPGSNLVTSTKYTLDIDRFAHTIDVPEGSSSQILHQRIGEALQMPEFETWVKMISHLRGESHVERPISAYPPIQLPQVNQQGLSHDRFYQPPIPRNVPINTASDGDPDYISEGDLLRIADKLPENWQALGIKLGLENSRLVALRTKHPHDVRLAILEMFGLWRMERGRSATRGTLKQALISIGYGKIAKTLFPND